MLPPTPSRPSIARARRRLERSFAEGGFMEAVCALLARNAVLRNPFYRPGRYSRSGPALCGCGGNGRPLHATRLDRPGPRPPIGSTDERRGDRRRQIDPLLCVGNVSTPLERARPQKSAPPQKSIFKNSKFFFSAKIRPEIRLSRLSWACQQMGIMAAKAQFSRPGSEAGMGSISGHSRSTFSSGISQPKPSQCGFAIPRQGHQR